MAHESFENPDTAKLMNDHFINIKLDREERPDLDHIYQQALSLMGEPGGWPLTMFLTPAGAPFFGGTYFPPEPKFGRPSFQQILKGVADSWQNERETVQYNVEALKGALAQESIAKGGDLPDKAKFDLTAQKLISGFDPKSGGFGSAPKFPQAPLQEFMLRYATDSDDDIYRKALLITLDNISQGGIYDHLGGGFFRYSTDEYWLVPHFEKMLYDNALMIQLLSNAYRLNPSRLYKARVEETIQFLMDEMTLENSACFAAALDADTDGKEGAYYIWEKTEIDNILGIDSMDFAKIYDVRDAGNWQNTTVLNRLNHQGMFNEKREAQLKSMREKLLGVRRTRTAPARDDKCLTDWNAMAIVSLCVAADTFENSAWRERAQAIFDELKDDIVHCRINGHVTAQALLDDYAWMMLAAVCLDNLETAKELYQTIQNQFADTKDGGFYTMPDQSGAVVRLKTVNDTAIPAANAVIIQALRDMAGKTGDKTYADNAKDIIRAFAGEIDLAPYAMGGFLSASYDLLINPSQHCQQPPCAL